MLPVMSRPVTLVFEAADEGRQQSRCSCPTHRSSMSCLYPLCRARGATLLSRLIESVFVSDTGVPFADSHEYVLVSVPCRTLLTMDGIVRSV